MLAVVVGAGFAWGATPRILLGAVVGGALALVTLSTGPFLLPRVLHRSPGVVLAVAVGGYAATVLALGVVYVVLRGAGRLDGTAVGAGLIVTTLCVGVGQTAAAVRERRPVFDGAAEG